VKLGFALPFANLLSIILCKQKNKNKMLGQNHFVEGN
jgi:hypothetical protein